MAIERAMLPSAEFSTLVTDLMNRSGLLEIDPEIFVNIIIDAAQVVHPSNFYEPYDTVNNHLLGLEEEYAGISAGHTPIPDIPNLSDDLCELAQRANRIMLWIGLGALNIDPERNLPTLYVIDMLPSGDVIVEVMN